RPPTVAVRAGAPARATIAVLVWLRLPTGPTPAPWPRSSRKVSTGSTAGDSTWTTMSGFCFHSATRTPRRRSMIKVGESAMVGSSARNDDTSSIREPPSVANQLPDQRQADLHVKAEAPLLLRFAGLDRWP